LQKIGGEGGEKKYNEKCDIAGKTKSTGAAIGDRVARVSNRNRDEAGFEGRMVSEREGRRTARRAHVEVGVKTESNVLASRKRRVF